MFLQAKPCFSALVGKSDSLTKWLLSEFSVLMYLALDRFLSKKSYLPLYLTQIIHSIGKMLFVWTKSFYQSFYGAPLTMKLSFTSRKSSVFHSRRQVTFQNVPKTQSKQFHLGLYLTQIVNSNSKMLFLQPHNCLSKFLWCAAHVYVFFNSKEKFYVSHASASHLPDVYFPITFARTIL